MERSWSDVKMIGNGLEAHDVLAFQSERERFEVSRTREVSKG